MSRALLRLEGIGRRYPRRAGRPAVTALAGVDLSVLPDEAVAVVGPSGAGKSTLVRIVLALEPPTAGRVMVGGHDLAKLPERRLRTLRRRFSAVLQDPWDALDPAVAVWRSVTEPLAVHGLAPRSARRAAADALVTSVGLDPERIVGPPATLSGGERQRAAIARALACEPELLVLDEPVAALDAVVRSAVLATLRQIRRDRQMAVLLVTHDLSAAAALCDRIVVLDRGRLVEQGPVDDVLARPTDRVTRELVAAAQSIRTA